VIQQQLALFKPSIMCEFDSTHVFNFNKIFILFFLAAMWMGWEFYGRTEGDPGWPSGRKGEPEVQPTPTHGGAGQAGAWGELSSLPVKKLAPTVKAVAPAKK
jgi:hypothetical protein